MSVAGAEAADPAVGCAAAAPVPRTVHRKRGPALEQAILAAAYQELSEAGYASFSVEAVAARAHTGKASIYRRWPTKHELVLDAIVLALPVAEQLGMGIDFPGNLTTAEALRQVAQVISRILTSPAGDAMRAVKCEAVVDPELARAVDDRFQAPRRAFLLSLLERGVARGEVRPEAVSPLVADVLPAVLTHRIILQREPLTEEDLNQIVELVLLPLVQLR
jgi:AcrR family transcriptional regulator